ncbi:MAG: hypothetical protein AAFV19_14800 [Pseudomonadota bacterium]
MTPLYDDPDYIADVRGHRNAIWSDAATAMLERTADIPDGAAYVRLRRVKASHKGIGAHRQIREVLAEGMDQAFFEEICALTNLEVLIATYPVTAKDLSGIRALTKLHTVVLDSPRNISDFTPLLELPNLRNLFIENAKHLTDLEIFREAHHLRVLGVEGTMSSNQKLASVAPLAGLRGLEALFLISVRLADKDLTPLARCPDLRLLSCARFAPKTAFAALQAAAPDLACKWCDRYDI